MSNLSYRVKIHKRKCHVEISHTPQSVGGQFYLYAKSNLAENATETLLRLLYGSNVQIKNLKSSDFLCFFHVTTGILA